MLIVFVAVPMTQIAWAVAAAIPVRGLITAVACELIGAVKRSEPVPLAGNIYAVALAQFVPVPVWIA